ncbi:hypothetical protein [Kutzneria sp. CA-103260]|uniref:hypothetical protein n=1 Tax=Kutzneria sp. CA-103260 TaxID=2802641 RepID=UPI001BADB1F1|nr:hypothetical protein [Kutzneria sp. CA-103260]QUQ70654.1 hypothetical protein JJ691_84370 [Kutzneria sp. CA-103260]
MRTKQPIGEATATYATGLAQWAVGNREGGQAGMDRAVKLFTDLGTAELPEARRLLAISPRGR